MKFFVSFVVFILLFKCFATAQTLIQDSCKKAAENDTNLEYNFCLQSLETDPQSKTATSLEGLLIASMNNAASTTTNVKGIVETILNNNKFSPSTEKALRTCVQLYDYANDGLNQALTYVKSHNYINARGYLRAALDNMIICEVGFNEKQERSPVTSENTVLSQKILIPLDFSIVLF